MPGQVPLTRRLGDTLVGQEHPPGTWLALYGLWVFIPEAATAYEIAAAAETILNVAEGRVDKPDA